MDLNLVMSLADSGPVSWGDLATWFLGLATFALFVVGLFQIRAERHYRIKREREGDIRKKRSQAELISAWIVQEGMGNLGEQGIEYPVAWVAVDNESSQPVYQVIVSLYAISQVGRALRGERPAGRACVPVVPPGRGYVQVGALYQGMHRRPGVEIGFEDRDGQAWARRPWGELMEVSIPIVEYYRIFLPRGWDTLEQEVPEESDWGVISSLQAGEDWMPVADAGGGNPAELESS